MSDTPEILSEDERLAIQQIRAAGRIIIQHRRFWQVREDETLHQITAKFVSNFSAALGRKAFKKRGYR